MTAALAVDPALRLMLRVALGLLFVWAALHKLRDVEAFERALGDYRLLPASVIKAAALALIAAETAVACTLPLVSGSGPALAAGLLLAIYAGAIGINLKRGRRNIDCGCAGPARRRPLSGGLIVRNAIVGAAALVAALPPSSRQLGWMDGVTIAGAVVFLCLLYGAVDGLLANAPHLNLRGWRDGAETLMPSLAGLDSFGERASPQGPEVAVGGVAG